MGLITAGFIFGVVAAVVAPSTHAARAPHESPGQWLPLVVGAALLIAYQFWLGRQLGYYARPGEVGFVGLFGRHRFREPVVHFQRFTMTNGSWVRFIGFGFFRAFQVIVGVTESGTRSLVLTPIIYPQADIDRFLSASGLAVKGEWSDRVPRFSLHKKWPSSADMRRQVWVTLAAIVPPIVVLVAAALAASAVLGR